MATTTTRKKAPVKFCIGQGTAQETAASYPDSVTRSLLSLAVTHRTVSSLKWRYNRVAWRIGRGRKLRIQLAIASSTLPPNPPHLPHLLYKLKYAMHYSIADCCKTWDMYCHIRDIRESSTIVPNKSYDRE